MEDEITQNNSGETRIEIAQLDLYSYYLQKIWPTYDIDYYSFEELMIKKGVIVTNREDEIPF